MPRYERNYTGEKRTEFLGFQLTPSERRQIEDAAKEAGSTLSEWARDLLLVRTTTAAMLRARRRNPDAAVIMRALDAASPRAERRRQQPQPDRPAPEFDRRLARLGRAARGH
jgi:hypothetical protein